MRVAIIGSGNVAAALARAVSDSPMELVQIHARNTSAGSAIARDTGCAYASQPSALAAADLYIIAVSDKAIGSLSTKFDFGDAVVAHTAGSVDMKELSPRIKHRAVIYPLQTFSKGRNVDFSQVPFMVEGTTDHALETVSVAAGMISENVAEYTSDQRAKAHLAAVFANNFPNHMYTLAENILTQAGMSFDLMKPLIVETAMKAAGSDSPRNCQTGPAVRGDFKTKNRHCEMLADNVEIKNLYINLSNNIWETLKKK